MIFYTNPKRRIFKVIPCGVPAGTKPVPKEGILGVKLLPLAMLHILGTPPHFAEIVKNPSVPSFLRKCLERTGIYPKKYWRGNIGKQPWRNFLKDSWMNKKTEKFLYETLVDSKTEFLE